MARQIGYRPEIMTMSEDVIYRFVMNELPDYICASFSPSVESKKTGLKFKCDMILFIPHMGVYVLDVSSAIGFQMQDGEFQYRYADGIMRNRSAYSRQNKLLTQRNMVRDYLKEMFNIAPLVYELECFPMLCMRGIDPSQLPVFFDPEHVLTADDLKDGMTFLRKVISCSINERSQVEKDYYEDLSDKDAHDLFYFWETGVLGAKRPDRPPFVFLSYNRNNAEISKDIQMVLEDRGVYVWRAPKDVSLGEYYLTEEMQAIEECDAFLILLSNPAQNSEEVKKEFVKAMEIKKPILPIWVESVADKDINRFYREHLTEYQYRVMPKLDEEIIEEIVAQVKRIKAQS